ncbi:hypothetical protein [Arthrobacter phage SWEP2]|uniref:Uncharacterized protein n=1 Tax=Arthrobacter phage SWEP2 TaxID=2945958 RepID=A0A9E7SGC6_9CAUD|nr:hypothetical protein [Arthrobacter phage SWEP2]
MSLIATARALDDPRFLWRVNAAAITVAAARVKETNSDAQVYAEYVLDNPMQQNLTLAALVACTPAVAAAIEVDAFNTVSTEAVPDTDILYVVGEVWATVAARHAERYKPRNAAATTTTAPA